MPTSEELAVLIPLACEWAEAQEKFILREGIPLSKDQLKDARQIGIMFPEKIRLLRVEKIPVPELPELRKAAAGLHFLTESTIGLSLRYRIFIQSAGWGRRSLVVHEMVHTRQYEQAGSFDAFLVQYLSECMSAGYLFSPMELEARRIEKEICGLPPGAAPELSLS